MATLPELPTSEVIELARSYLSGWGGIPLPDDIASEALNRLDIALAAVRQAMKERDEQAGCGGETVKHGQMRVLQ